MFGKKKQTPRLPMNNITDQLKQMEADRKALVKRVQETTGFERDQAAKILRAHDMEVGRLLDLK